MPRRWIMIGTIFDRKYMQTGSASAELYIDPTATIMAEVALNAYQDGGARIEISNVNDRWGDIGSCYFGDGVWRIAFNMTAVGGNEAYLRNTTEGRMVVHEYSDGPTSFMGPGPGSSSLKSIVYDRATGDILHTDEVLGSEERLKEFAGGKLDARAHDYVRRLKVHDGKFDVIPVTTIPTLKPGKSLKVDVKKQALRLVTIKPAASAKALKKPK